MKVLPFFSTIGGYRVLAEIGRGAFGAVYRVVDPETGGELALKLFARASDGETAFERFRQEPQALGRVAPHPNLIAARSVGEEAGLPFFTMDLVVGRGLDVLLEERGRLDAREAAGMARKLALALAHIHEAGLVHRDVKPANVVVEASGEPRLIDLSLALDTLRQSRLTAAGRLVGTPRYMAPEQLDPDGARLGPRTDVFALGAVLYEMLTGEPPFAAASLDERRRAFAAPPPRPDARVPDIPAALGLCVLHALEVDPERRPPSAAAFANELGGFLGLDARAPVPLPWAAMPARTDDAGGAGRRVGEYEVLSVLGRGGMGVVLRARDAAGREVAVKVLRGGHESAIARFERERRLLEGLGAEEGFVPLLGWGDSPEGPFIVMPLIGGGSLEERLRRGPLSIEAAVALGRSLASSIARAHERGIVHRDLKPANVLFTQQGRESGDWGRPLIADLGLGKHFDRTAPGASQSASLSKTGSFMGTPGYMAPEQMRDAKASGPAVDVFALGAILYECVAGRPAFGGGNLLELLAAVAEGRSEPLGKTRAGVPAWLESAVARSLAHDPGARFADARELARALDAAPSRPRKRVALAVGAVGVAAVGLAASFTRARPPAGSPPGPVASTEARLRTESPAPASPLPAPFERLAPGRSLRLVAAWGDPAWSVPACSSIVFTPDGKKLIATGDESIWILDAATGLPERILEPGAGDLVGCAVSPSGKLLLVSSAGRPAPPSGRYQPLPSGPSAVQLWDLERGELVRTLDRLEHGETKPFGGVAFSPNGRLAYVVGPFGGVRVYDVATGREPVRLGNEPSDPALSISAGPPGAEGKARLLAGGATKLRLWDDVTTNKSLAFEGNPGGTVAVALYGDRRHAATGGADGSVRISDLATEESITLAGHRGAIASLALSRDERVLATSGADGQIKTWNATTGELLGTIERPPSHGGPSLDPTRAAGPLAFAPDGDLVVAAWDQRLRRYDSKGRLLVGAATPAGQVLGLAVDPRGRFVVTGARDGSVLVRDARTGSLVRELAARAGEVWCVEFSPDGSRLAAAGWSGDVVVWDVPGWDESARFTNGAMTFGVALDQGGRRAVTTGWFEGARVVELATGDRRATLPGYARWLRRAAFTPDGKRVVAGVDHDACALWDVETQRVLRTFKVGLELQWIAVSKDGRLLLVAANPGHASLWSLDGSPDDGKPLRRFEGHTGKVVGCALSPDATLAATVSEDRTVRLWEVVTGRELDRVDLAPICDRPDAVQFLPDGASLVVSTDRSLVLRFEIAR